jgi:hypothetical protein
MQIARGLIFPIRLVETILFLLFVLPLVTVRRVLSQVLPLDHCPPHDVVHVQSWLALAEVQLKVLLLVAVVTPVKVLLLIVEVLLSGL